MRLDPFVLSGVLLMWHACAVASQLSPLGSSYEASLTNESESRLAWVANRLGRMIKSPVHEEITQLGFACPAALTALETNTLCAVRDAPFASPFVIYGVRWNDLPPFQLAKGEGRSCKRILSSAPACRLDQTVRFSTQPECWYCLFKDAERRSMDKLITGCDRGDQYVRGNLMTRSHFGDLQFLHAMASTAGVPAEQTRDEVIDWLEFAWKVASGKTDPEAKMKDFDLPTFKSRFGCSEWTVADIFILGRNDKLRPMLDRIALGAFLHVIQDSFSYAHVEREAPVAGATCDGATAVSAPGRVKEFHTYAQQDQAKHDARDTREAMVDQVIASKANVVYMTRVFADLDRRGVDWDEVAPVVKCAFALSTAPRRSSAGADLAPTQADD